MTDDPYVRFMCPILDTREKRAENTDSEEGQAEMTEWKTSVGHLVLPVSTLAIEVQRELKKQALKDGNKEGYRAVAAVEDMYTERERRWPEITKTVEMICQDRTETA